MPGVTEISDSANALLLVEGNDQLRFFRALATDLERTDIQVENFGGIYQLRRTLLGVTPMPGFAALRSLGIVRDAERSTAGAFQSVQGSLRAADLPVPDELGTPSADDGLAVSVWLLPGDDRPGMLETLLCDTIEEGPEAACIDDFLECLGHLDDSGLRWADKRRARAFLATKPDPNLRVGEAAERGYWNLDHAALAPVREFLTAL